VICGQLPIDSKLSFGSIVMYTKFPISIKDIKKGLSVRVPIGLVTPQKNTIFEGDSIEDDTLVKQVHLNAKMISQKKRTRGSRTHHKFTYVVKNGELVSKPKTNYRRI
jgi:hypothetical protein